MKIFSKNDYLKNAIAATNKQASKLRQLHRNHETVMQLMQLGQKKTNARNKQMKERNKHNKQTYTVNSQLPKTYNSINVF